MKIQISIDGKKINVPAEDFNGQRIIVTGKGVKIASVLDEKITPGEVVSDPQELVAQLKNSSNLNADIFTFAQKPTHPEPIYDYPIEWENAAIIPITTYHDWLNERAATDVRQNVRKSARRGVDVRRVEFDDDFVRGIVDIFNESPIRQGRPFWHFGKDFAQINEEVGHCLEKSFFVGAYVKDELIGFIKLLQTGNIADLVLIISKNSHRDKRPTNALIAKAVETCVDENIGFLTYAEFEYYKNKTSSLSEFKKRNGFERVDFPRYYIPLNLKGRAALIINLQHGLKGVMPASAVEFLRTVRSRFFSRLR